MSTGTDVLIRGQELCPWKGQTSRELVSVALSDEGLCKVSGGHWYPVGCMGEAEKTEKKGGDLCFLQGVGAGQGCLYINHG